MTVRTMPVAAGSTRLMLALVVSIGAVVQGAEAQQEADAERVFLGRPAALASKMGDSREYIEVPLGTALHRAPTSTSELVGTTPAVSVLEVVGVGEDGWRRVLWQQRKVWLRLENLPAVELVAQRLRTSEPTPREEQLWQRAQLLSGTWNHHRVGRFQVQAALGEDDPLWVESEKLISCLPAYVEKRVQWASGAKSLPDSDQPGAVASATDGSHVPVPESRLVLFADRGEYERFARDDLGQVGAGTRGHALEGVAVLSLDQELLSDNLALLAHELVHLETTRWFPTRLPVWLEEGLAEEVAWSVAAFRGCPSNSGFPESEVRKTGQRIDRDDQDRIRVVNSFRARASGKQVDAGCAWPAWENGDVSLEELVTLPPAYLRTDPRRQHFYVVAAATTRYLMEGGSDAAGVSERFRDFLAAHRSSRLDPPAFADLVVSGDEGLQALEAAAKQWFQSEILPKATACSASP